MQTVKYSFGVDYMTIKEVAKYLGIGEQRAYRWERMGRLPKRHTVEGAGKRTLFSRVDIEQFKDEHLIECSEPIEQDESTQLAILVSPVGRAAAAYGRRRELVAELTE